MTPTKVPDVLWDTCYEIEILELFPKVMFRPLYHSWWQNGEGGSAVEALCDS